MLILAGKPKGKNGHSWDSVRNCPDDAEVPQPLYVLFIYSFLQQAFIDQLLCNMHFARHMGFNGK